MTEITYMFTLEGVDWVELKTILQQDHFDNGRSPEQLETSFKNSHASCVAYAGDRIIGTARVLSDGICNAYLVDVWTLSSYRHQGIATAMIEALFKRLNGQHVYLQTDNAMELYAKLGFKEQPVGMGMVVGKWLVNDPVGRK